jgi:murein DD-endopeptidase MepM/ murein hydrolase activator NlpD
MRRLIPALAVVIAACSQRAPLRVVAAPAPRQQAEAIAAPTPLDSNEIAHLRSLVFPVANRDSARFDDSFDEPRDGGARRHNAIDIMAPLGSPVLAVSDGRILRLAQNAKGGNTIYATDLEEHFVYYYAHLDRYHASIYDGKPLLRGDTIGYVGTSGNAPKNLPHLHFQVMRMPVDGHYWNGEPINPYPLLRPTTPAPAAK